MRQRIAAFGSVGVAAILGLFLLWGGIDTKPLSAMEKMAENIRKAKSYKCKQIVQLKEDFPQPGQPALTETTYTVYWVAPGSSRSERIRTFPQTGKETGPEATSIRPAGKPGISIYHPDKTFRRYPTLRRNAFSSIFDDLENLGEFSGKADRELGTKEINGKKARGFEIDRKKIDSEAEPGSVEIWIDTESNLPILVRYPADKKLGQTMTQVDTDIEWNIDLAPKLFDVTPPEGYTDATPKPPTLEEQVRQITVALQIFAGASGGYYPRKDTIDYFTTYDLCELLGVSKWPTFHNWPAKEEQEKAARAAKAIDGFDRIGTIHSYNPDFAYYGKTVGPKDKDKVLLRWKLDDGRYEVIFGDLRSETVTAEKLRALEGK